MTEKGAEEQVLAMDRLQKTCGHHKGLDMECI